MELESHEVERGTHLLLDHLEKLIDEDPEISDLHGAFELFCKRKHSIGDASISTRTGRKGDCGIDFYSTNGTTYHIAQCKIPTRDWLEAHPEKIRSFSGSAVNDCRDALNYLFGTSKLKANEHLQYLFGQIQSDKNREDFSLVVFLLVFGRLNERARADFEQLKKTSGESGVRLVLQEIDDIIDDFLVGSGHAGDKVEIRLRRDKDCLNSHDYSYFLANAADIFTAFKDYGWRLFDLNLRYEIRNSTVNGNIVNSLKYHRTRKNFHHYNNGLIIVCEQYRPTDAAMKIINAQVINGLQTVKSIYNAVTTKEVTLEELEKDCRVQVKVIRNDKPEFVADVVQATNNQNPMAPRNVKSNEREQKLLRREFSSVEPRWFFQVKQGEWESLTQEGGRFFKAVVGHPIAEYKPNPNQKRGRVLDNQDAAKAWLAFAGFSDWAGDRTTHYFANGEVYDVAFRRSPNSQHWRMFVETTDFHATRMENLDVRQPTAYQYLLATFIWELIRHYIPSPRQYRDEALQEGVIQGKIRKADGSFISSVNEQESFLTENHTYQTWRLMANMKELLVESAAYILAHRFSSLDEQTCKNILFSFEANSFLSTGEVKSIANAAATATDLSPNQVFSRIMGYLRYVAGQYWEDKRAQILATSRVRTLLLRQDMVTDFKAKVLELNNRIHLDRPWKPEGTTFFDSLPQVEDVVSAPKGSDEDEKIRGFGDL